MTDPRELCWKCQREKQDHYRRIAGANTADVILYCDDPMFESSRERFEPACTCGHPDCFGEPHEALSYPGNGYL